MWFYFITLSLGVSVALGWFALLEWHNKRQWERYRRNWVGHSRKTPDYCGVHGKQRAAEEITRAGMDERPGRDDSKA